MGANALYDTLGCPAEGKVEQPLSRPMAGRDHPLDKTETLSGACSLNCVIDVKGSSIFLVLQNIMILDHI